MRAIVSTEQAPRAIGPYSQAVRAADTVWASGQIGLEPSTGRLAEGGIEAETRQAIENLRAVLEAAGSSLDRVLKVTVFLTDLAADFEAMNRTYADFFGPNPPARTTVEVRALPRGARVEMDAVALTG